MDQFDWLRDRMDRIETKVDTIQEHCSSIDKTLIRNTADVEYHIKRTDLAEESIKAIRDQIKPISRHVTMMEGAFKLVLAIGVIAGAIYSVLKIFSN